MEHEATLRLIFFAATAVSLGLWEARSPRRKHDPGRTYRWIGNLGVVAGRIRHMGVHESLALALQNSH